jgi:alkylation response protein AidB-like acyl-CoA dehydrogenase
MSFVPEHTLQVLSEHADRADTLADWPAESWGAVRASGLLARGVPRQHGGEERSAAELLRGMETLASACLTTAFILSQREAALRQVIRSENAGLRERFLPALARGEVFLTVGISQLTTSRQHRTPALVATPVAAEYRLDGEAPWVTAADHADGLVLGAALPDGRQALFLVPGDKAGVKVGAPLPLAALAGSRTAAVRCDGVELGAEWLLAGPAESLMASGGGGLETSAVALGLAGAAIGWLEAEAARRPDLAEAAAAFARERAVLQRGMEELALASPSPEKVLALRVEATMLMLRATQAAMAAAKGAGFLAGHPVLRWARQGLFFLVWSCPRSVAQGILARLVHSEPGGRSSA